jgi:hypothetical protein
VSDIYYPEAHEIRGLGRNLAANQIIYVRQALQFFEPEGPVVHHQAFWTSVVDLTRGTDELFEDSRGLRAPRSEGSNACATKLRFAEMRASIPIS